MGSTIGPAPRGLNSRLLDSERRLKAFLASIIGGGDDEEMTFDPSRAMPPTRPLGGITQRPPRPETFDLPPVYQQREQPQSSNIPPEAFMGMESAPPTRRRRPTTMQMGGQRDLSDLIKPNISMGSPEEPVMGMGRQRDLSNLLDDPTRDRAIVNQPVSYGMDEEEEMSPSSMYDRYSRDEPRTEEYLGHLRSRPRHEDYRPSTGRKIGAGILGALLGTDFGIREAPYNRELRKWSDEGAGLAEGSKIEQTSLVEKRRSLKDIMRYEQQQRRLEADIAKAKRDFDVRNREIARKEQQGADRNEIDRLRYESTDRYRNDVIQLRRDMMTNVSIPRVQAYGRGVNARVEGMTNLTGKEQENILEQAYREVGQDPRYSEWFDPDYNRFKSTQTDPMNSKKIIKTIDPGTKELIQREVLKRQRTIAERNRSSYQRELLSEDWYDPFSMDDALLGDEEGGVQ